MYIVYWTKDELFFIYKIIYFNVILQCFIK